MIGAQPGEIIAGRYEVAEKLGEGAFGVTFGGIDRVLGTHVVLKIASSDAPDVAERLRQEAAALGELRHPGIVGLLGLAQLEDGRPMLVFERVHGESVADRLRRTGPLSLEEALAIVRSVAEALAYAHRRGIIHRDLKPSNVLLRGGNPADAKLSDFGALGRLEGNREGGRTRVGQLFGTILYMAPEQIRADPQTPATDVYGLGALLHEMLFGGPPFYDRRENLTGFVAAVMSESPEIPDEPKVPARIRDLLVRMLAKGLEQRPSLEEVLQTIGSTAARYVRLPAAGPAVPEPTATATAESTAQPFPALPPPLPPAPSPRAAGPVLERARFPVLPLVAAALLGLLLFLGIFLVLGPAGGFPTNLGPPLGRTAGAILLGLALGISGPLLAGRLVRLGDRRLDRARHEANEIVTGTRSSDVLGSTLARYVQELRDQSRRIDERFLSATIARMIADYESAESFDQRQTALMNAVELLDRLMERLSPWWVRYQKPLAFLISLVGVVSGVISILAGVTDLLGR